MKNNMLKRLLVIVLALSVVMAIMPTAFAQDGAASEDTHSEAVATDTAHGETAAATEEAGGLSALGINTGFLLAQIVNFALLLSIFYFFLGAAVNFLDSRSAKIQKGIEDAAAAARARQNAEAEADKILAEARAERQKLLEDARQQGEDVKKQIESEARQNAERIRAEGQQDAVTARDAELANLRDQVLQISTAVAGRILGESVDAKKQSKLVSDFLSTVPEGAKKLSGAVEVISAMPLSDDEKKSVEKAISADSYSYSVDPNILGGLIVRSQDRVVDGSVRGGLGELTSRLK